MSPFIQLLTDHQAGVALGLLALVFAGFLTERFPPAVIAAGGAGLFIALGLLSPDDAMAAFSNSAPITIAAMFILSGALVRTGTLEAAAGRIVALAETRPRFALLSLLGATMVASAFMNNTPVVLVLIPLIIELARTLGVQKTRLLIPLSYVAVLGGTLTLIGTSTNLVVDGVARRHGQEPFSLFEITPIGLVAAGTGCLSLFLLSRFLLPKRADPDAEDLAETEQVFLTELRVPEGSRLVGRQLSGVGALSPRGIKVVTVKRGGRNLKPDDPDLELEAEDRLVVRATLTEALGLAKREAFDMGLQRAPSLEDARIVEVSIASNHVGIGSPLSRVPFASRLPVRIVGISRYRHNPGPDLASTRLRAGDRLLVEAGEPTIGALARHPTLIVAGEPPARPYRRQRAPIAIAALALVVGLAALGVLSIGGLALIAVAAILLLRCIDAEEAWESVDGNVLVLIFAMLMVGRGLEDAGSLELIVSTATPWLREASPFLLLLGIYGLTSALTEMVSNTAVAVILTPLVIALGGELGIDPRPLVVAVMFGASASFATPIGYQTNTLVYSAGNYRFADFLRIGLPMNVIVGVITCVAIRWLML